METERVTLSLCGDVMLGRGIDQMLPRPGSARLWERYIDDARRYVELAESAHGPIPRPVGFGWPWGDALSILNDAAPDVRLLNLETSVTGSEDADLRKAVHYRMSPGNLPCLLAGRPDVCVLANNHVLDFGLTGLDETLDTLTAAGIQGAGAGRDETASSRPAVCAVGGGRRVVVSAYGAATSGVPLDWAAGPDRPGIAVLEDLSDDAATELVDRVALAARPGDVVVVSLHWGPNWGYEVTTQEADFAHRLVDGGVDVVFGHSSHHPRPIEVYRGRLILYGCGDLVDDYEGISGHDEFRGDLRLLYLASVDAATGALAGLRMAPLQARRFRLRRSSTADTEWLRDALDTISRPFGARADPLPDGMIGLRWDS